MENQFIVNFDNQIAFRSDFDSRVYNPVKRRKVNPVGEDIYLLPDGSIVFDEDKIIKIQRIFMDNYYKPGGKGAEKTLSKYCPGSPSMDFRPKLHPT